MLLFITGISYSLIFCIFNTGIFIFLLFYFIGIITPRYEGEKLQENDSNSNALLLLAKGSTEGHSYENSKYGLESFFEQRVVLIANICRCQNGKLAVFMSDNFIKLISNLLSQRNNNLSVGVIYSCVCILFAIAPLYHSTAYPFSTHSTGLNGSKVKDKADKETSRVAHLLMASLMVSASSRDLTAIDKVYSTLVIL